MVRTANAYQSWFLLFCQTEPWSLLFDECGADRIGETAECTIAQMYQKCQKKTKKQKGKWRKDYLCQCCLFNVGCASAVACTDRSALILLCCLTRVCFFCNFSLFIHLEKEWHFCPSLFFLCVYVALRLCAIGIMCSKVSWGQVGARQAVALHIVGVVLLAYSWCCTLNCDFVNLSCSRFLYKKCFLWVFLFLFLEIKHKKKEPLCRLFVRILKCFHLGFFKPIYNHVKSTIRVHFTIEETDRQLVASLMALSGPCAKKALCIITIIHLGWKKGEKKKLCTLEQKLVHTCVSVLVMFIESLAGIALCFAWKIVHETFQPVEDLYVKLCR